MKKVLVLMAGLLFIGANLYAGNGDLIVNGNLGVGTTIPSAKLDIGGNIKTYNLIRGIPTALNDYVELGYISGNSFSAKITLSKNNGYSIGTKVYMITANYHTSQGWQQVIPFGDSGVTNGNNFSLEANWSSTYGPLYLRIRLSKFNSATPPSGLMNVAVQLEGNSSLIETAGTGTAEAPTAFFSGSSLVQLKDNVGIGTTSPGYKLEVKDTSNRQLSASHSSNQEIGGLQLGNYVTLQGHLDPDNSYRRLLLAEGAYYDSTTNNYKLTNALWDRAAMEIMSGGHITFKTEASDRSAAGTMTLSEWDGIERMRITSTGSVGIGETYPGGYKLFVSGPAYSTSSWQSSDIKFKKDILPIDESLNKLLQLKGVSYEYKINEYRDKDFPEGRHYGVLAQEVEKVIPGAVKEDADGSKAVAYTELIPILIEAVKEQQKKIEELEKKVAQLK